jgi:hypothetical protein
MSGLSSICSKLLSVRPSDSGSLVPSFRIRLLASKPAMVAG